MVAKELSMVSEEYWLQFQVVAHVLLPFQNTWFYTSSVKISPFCIPAHELHMRKTAWRRWFSFVMCSLWLYTSLLVYSFCYIYLRYLQNTFCHCRYKKKILTIEMRNVWLCSPDKYKIHKELISSELYMRRYTSWSHEAKCRLNHGWYVYSSVE